MKFLVTGAAGFIGFHLSRLLAEKGHEVVGLDNINDYYSQQLKFDRLKQLGISADSAEKYNEICTSGHYSTLKFIRLNLEDRENLPSVFENFHFDKVINLAAQAGVRYSIENPEAYIDSNIVGFSNLLECCRQSQVKHLIYASSSSVYGQNKKVPFSVKDSVDEPISLYAATKKSNELMAHTYSHLYNISTTGLRFFTVYGPWGRPDMAMFLFTDAIVNHKPIQVFNLGNQERDFTYIDDICEGVLRICKREVSEGSYSLYNIGNSKPINLMKFIEAIEDQLGIQAKKEFLPAQPGDVARTWADVEALVADYNYKPVTSIETGVRNFIKWYKAYYQ